MPDDRVSSLAHWGAFTAVVEAGRIVRVEPFAEDCRPASLLRSVPSAVHAACRIEQPMVRQGWRKDRDRSGRGAEPFVPVSWDEASRLIAEELGRVKEAHGNQAIFNGSCGWASAGRFHHARLQLQRFLNLHGGFTFHVANYSYGAGMTVLPHILGSDQPLTGPWTDWRSIIAETRLVVAFGGLPLKNLQMDSGGVADHTAEEALHQAKAAGIRFVNVSPIAADTGEFLGAEWWPIVPNSDTALMLGLAHTLLEEGLCDHRFLERCTTGAERFLAYLRGSDDGEAKSAQWAAPLCGIAAERIRGLAREMAATRSFLTASWSVQRGEHGEQPYWALVALAAMLGQIGLPGGGFGFGYGSINRQGSPSTMLAPPRLPVGSNPVQTCIPAARCSDMLLNPGATIDFNGQRLTYPDIRLLYLCGGNPFHHQQETNRLLAALQRPETIIVHEPWWNPMARHADIVLPATTTLERNDIGAGALDPYFIAMKQAIPPQGQARNDHDILAEIADRLGFREAFTGGRSEIDWLRHIYEVARAAAAESQVSLPDFDAFWAAGGVKLPVPEEPTVALAAFRRNPRANPLPTPSGRIELCSERVAGWGYRDCPGHPVWLAPREWLGAAAAERYPLHLITNQPATRLHSQLDMAAVSQDSKVAGREPVWIHPEDAAARGIASGDVVRIWNDRGATLAGAVLTDRIRPRVIRISTGAWYDPLEPGRIGSLDRHGSANMLTQDRGCSSLSQSPSAQSALVEIERWTAGLPEITVFVPPATAPG